MKKGGIGVGSASIVLVFAVLCLTVFTLITFLVAGNERALVDSEALLVAGYYKADALAEQIVADILAADAIPEEIGGVEIGTFWDYMLGADIVYFSSIVSDQKSLFVRLALHGGSYDILSWRMYDTGEWEFDDRLHVWLGPDDFDLGDPAGALTGLDALDPDD